MARPHATAAIFAMALSAAGRPAFSEEAPTTSTGTKSELVIGIREYLSDVPAMIADKDGLYAQEGAKVRTILRREGRDNGVMLREGTVDLAIVGNHIGVEALSEASKDDPLVVLACLGGGGDRWRLMVSTRSAATSLEGLQKVKLGAWPRSYGYHLLERILREKGIQPEVVRVPMEPELAVAAFEKGEVDALFAWEPIPAMLEAKGLAREIFTLKGKGEGVPIYLAAHRSVVRDHPAQILAVLRALDRATALVNADPERAAQRVSPLLNIPAEVLNKALQKHEFQLGLTCRQRESLTEAAQAFRERDLNRIPPDLTIEFDPGPLKAFLQDRGAGPAVPFEEDCPVLQKLDVGYFLGGRTSILMRIQEAGGFDAEGLRVALLTKSLRGDDFSPIAREQVEEQQYQSKATGAELLDGLFKGSWDLATIGESSFLAAVSEKKPVLAVAKLGSDLSDKSGHLFAVKKGLKLLTPGDYRGKVFVSRRAGPGDETFLLEYLAQAGIDVDRDVLVLPKLPSSLAEKLALPQDKVLLVKQVFEDDLARAVREGLVDGGYFHLMPYEQMKDLLDMVKPLHDWIPPDHSMAVLVCRSDYAAKPEGRAKTVAFLRAFIKRVKLEKSMTPEMRRAQTSSEGRVQRWRGLDSPTPGANYPQYDEDPKIEPGPLASMAALLRKHKLVDWPDLDLAPHIDNSLVEQAVRELGEARK